MADHAMEDDRDLILVNDRLNFVQSGETSAHSELTNDLTSYLNLVLAGYYATLGSNKKKPSVQSAIKKVLKVLDLNFAGAKDLLTVTPEDVARTIDDSVVLDHQGICWQDWDTRGVFLELRQKDLRNFYDVRKSHVNSRHNVNRHPQYCNSYFQFKSYFRCTQPYLVHFQLRNLMLAVDKSSVIVSDYNRAAASFEVRRLNPETGEVLVLMDQEVSIQTAFGAQY